MKTRFNRLAVGQSGRRPAPARLTVAGCVLLACLGSAGCAGTTQASLVYEYEYPAVRVETVPAYVYYQPRVYYRGRYAYLVDGRWYYPSQRGWVVFREEPRELQRYRINSGDRTPYSYRYRGAPEYRYRSAPEYRYRSAPEYRYRRTPEYGSPPPPRRDHRYKSPY